MDYQFYIKEILLLFIVLIILFTTVSSLIDDNAHCSQWCINGHCDEKNECKCQPCWMGIKCDQYDDPNGARFLEENIRLYLKLENLKPNKPIYWARAVDQDSSMCNENGNCSCATIEYKIQQQQPKNELEQLFGINRTTGELFILSPEIVELETEYKLIVMAYNPNTPLINADNDKQMAMMNIFIKVQNNLERIRRQATGDDEDERIPGLTFRLRTLGGETNSLQVGNSIHYKMEIALPKGPSDLLLDIITLDIPMANRSSISLYNFSMPFESTAIQFNIPEPKFYFSNYTANVYDRMTLDFGTIKNNGPENNVLTICFSAILVRKPRKAKKKHTIDVNVSYNHGSLTTVAQSEITTASLPSKDDQIFLEVYVVDSPDKIALDSAATFRFNVNLQIRSDPVRIELNKTAFEYEPDNLISLGLISVTKLGDNYQAIPTKLRHYAGIKNMTLSQTAYSISVLDMNLITNNGEKGRSFLKLPGNNISFAFNVFALNYEENIGRNVSFELNFFVGKRSFFTHIFNVTIVKRNSHERLQSIQLDSNGTFNNENVTIGGVTQLKIQSKFHEFTSENVFTDYSVMVSVPGDHSKMSIVPCAARLLNEGSGLNIPYVNPVSIKPRRNNENKFLFQFDRLNFVKLIKSFAANDNVVAVEITFTVPFDSAITTGEDSTLKVDVSIISGQKTTPVQIENNALSIVDKINVMNEQSIINMRTFPSVKWDDLIVAGGAGVNIELEFPPNSAYQNFRLSIMKDGSNGLTLPEMNICHFTVVKVDRNMPCTCVNRETINEEQIHYEKLNKNVHFNEQASIDFGSISVMDSFNYGKKILTTFSLMIEEKIDVYPIKIDVLSNNNVIVSDILNLNVSETIKNRIDQVWLELELLEKKPIAPGFSTTLLIKVLTQPNTIGPLSVEVISKNDNVSVCGLWIERIGHNLPCIDPNKTADYYFTDFGKNKRAILNFEMITNFGNQIRKSERDEFLDNSLEFISMIRIADTATNDQTIKIKVNYGFNDKSVIKELRIPVRRSNNLEYHKPKQILLKTNDNTNFIQPTIPKMFYYEIQLENNTQTRLKIALQPSNDYKMCNAAFIMIGRNYPCFSPFSLNYRQTELDIGMVCNTYLNRIDPMDNLLRLAFAIRPNENILSSNVPFTLSSIAYVGQQAMEEKNELSLTVDSNYTYGYNANQGTSIEPDLKDNIPFKIRERKWIRFNIRIPAFSTGKLSAIVRGESKENRAFIVLYDLRLVHAGPNIPCPFENVPKIQLNSTINNNQTNLIVAELGWFANFAFSYYVGNKSETEKFNDDLLKFEVLAELTDHPSLSQQSDYKLEFETNYGNLTNTITSKTIAGIKLTSLDEPNPKLLVNIKYKKRMPVLDRNETFTLTATVKHLPESNAEPYNPVLRMFTPNFVEILAINWANTEKMPELKRIDEGSTDIMFPWLLFNEEFTVNFTVQIDPKNIRGYGHKELTLITPYRMMCQHFRYNNANKKFPCSKMKHINYKTESSECNIPLGMANGKILDGQLSASSAVGRQFSPQNARPNAESFWSPWIRNWNSEHYIQIDFKIPTRLYRVVYYSVDGMRRITKYHIKYSYDGYVWYNGTNATDLVYNGQIGDSLVQKPIEARFVRFVIDSVNRIGGKETENQYIAVKFELFGCYLENNHSPFSYSSLFTPTALAIHPNAETAATTHFTDEISVKNRHIAIDPYTNVIYFCDATSSENRYMCFYSNTGGNSWNIIGGSIDSFEGFELATGKFFAVDYDRPAYFFTTDGKNWTPIDFETFNSTVTHPKFQPKTIIPRFTKNDIKKLDIRIGNWQANYEGLKYEDNQYPKALWTKCCNIE